MMIKNFEEVKKQLSELSEVINQFKSEQVQLKLVELVFKGTWLANDEDKASSEHPAIKRAAGGRKRKAKAAAPPESHGGAATKPAKSKTRSKAGTGPTATLRELLAEGYFKEKKTIGQIVNHCETKMARSLKSNEISPHLRRLVQEKSLTRSRNDENQYEYTQA